MEKDKEKENKIKRKRSNKAKLLKFPRRKEQREMEKIQAALDYAKTLDW